MCSYSTGSAYPTVSGRLTVVAPSWIAASTTRQRNSRSLRLASSAENSTSSRSEEHTSELQSPYDLVCRLLLEKKNISHRRRSTVNGDSSALYPCFEFLTAPSVRFL